MASVYRDASGVYQVQFKGIAGKRQSLWLGKCDAEFAEEFGLRVERLLKSLNSSQPIDKVTQAWLEELDGKYRNRLQAKGLLSTGSVSTISQLCDYVIARADVGERAEQKYRDAKASLVSYFGDHRGIFQVTPGDADDFVAWLKKHGRRPTPGPLSPFTVSKRVEQVKHYFSAAVRKRWIAANPFDGVSVPAVAMEDRKRYIDRETVAKVMEAASPDLALIIALARYLGLRTPSETWPLKWEWVNWETGIITVLDSKRRRHGAKKWRFVPIFPEIQEQLQQQFHSERTDPVFIFNRKWLTITDTALRNQLERVCLRANVKPWVKPWQNLRSTRETELVDQGYPVHVACDWLGNSPKVAYAHYLQIAKEHAERALGDTCIGLHRFGETARATSAKTSAPSSGQVES